MGSPLKGNNVIAVRISAVQLTHFLLSTVTMVVGLKSNGKFLEMTLNGSGIRDIARVLHISPTTVIKELKKRASAPARQFHSHSTQRIQVRSSLRSSKWKKLKSTKCGVLWGRKPNNDGCGMPLIMERV